MSLRRFAAVVTRDGYGTRQTQHPDYFEQPGCFRATPNSRVTRSRDSRSHEIGPTPLEVHRKPRCTLGFVVAVSVTLAVGCTKYPQVGFENLEYVAALRTACSAQNVEWLAKTKAAIEKEHASGAIGTDEYAAYREIVATAEAGGWEKAEAECLRFQKDQLAE